MALADFASILPVLGLAGGGGVYLTGEDHLRLTTIGALASAVVTIEGRIVQPGGRVVPFVERHVPNSNYTSATSLHQLGEGILLNAQVRVITGTGLRGHIFAVLEVGRGLQGAFIPLMTLAQGYVTTNGRLAYPGSTQDATNAGGGRMRTISGTDPAAGVEVSETVPAGAMWRPISFSVGLVTDATVANRFPVLTIDDGTTVFWQTASNVALTASLLGIYRAAQGAPLAQIGTTHFIVPFPSWLRLAAGSRLRTITTNLQAGDNYTAPTLHVEEFVEG